MAINMADLRRAGSQDLARKPLPALPQPASPTLTNPDMVLPDVFSDNISLTSPPKMVRPPSPSYLVQQKQYAPTKTAGGSNRSHRPSLRHMASQRSTTPEEDEPVIRTSPARRAQYRYSHAGLGSSPTVSMARLSPGPIDLKRLSASDSSITSEDLYAMRIPGFDDLEDDAETLTDGEFDGPSPSEKWRAGEQMEPPETEESAATLMRAEMILANAKKRLNLFDQNLRGAREIVAPLTAANLKRATSMHAAYIQPVYYGRTGYPSREDSQVRQQAVEDGLGHTRVLSDTAVSPAQDRPYTSLGRAAIPIKTFTPSWKSNPLRGTRSQEQLRTAIPPNGQMLPRAQHSHSPEPKLETLMENDATSPATVPPRDTFSRASTATDLREQMDELKDRISSLKERAREDSLRRRSMQSLRQTTPVVHYFTESPERRDSRLSRASSASIGRPPMLLPDNPSPPLTEDGEIVFDPRLGYAAISPRQPSFGHDRAIPLRAMGALSYGDDDTTTASTRSSGSSTERSKTVTAISEESENDSIYEDAPSQPLASQRHEDREDAFDYNNFFLHSSLGTFSRPRGSSVSSTDSAETAKGPARFDQVPPTPETPETLREIERNMHARAMSTESIESAASFATAEEAIRSGRQTPQVMAEWLVPKPRDGRVLTLDGDRADSGVGVAEQATAKVAEMIHARPTSRSQSSSQSRPSSHSRSRSSTHTSRPSLSSVPPSPSAIAVSALLDPKARPLGFKDKALVFTVVESLKQLCEKLQAEGQGDCSGPVLRKRLDNARRMLDGSLPPVM